ncbi:SMC family ATPase [Oculatella sp. LEGE 06141]|uniref:AAA family ATPase n=1 Tax=Oculatella sp. LEGE 06141 TaxID=1828648 RepID=UPI00187FF64E|nr:SMC family ATPase [Oculatella sp. LEGE 06141]MBE9182072.1 SMC family ATPase [Oculatella sp. LEGE 06141]
MIPQFLSLKNFLSYREATLDFRGLHVACICGANGAGKSSLLEAIAWAVWGQSRASSEDDIIHIGATETAVDFTFQCHTHIYRIIRTRYRRQTSSLEFQVETPNGFRSLTERSIRATQHLILQHLKLDYETFINSAYLRQGRADEFMLKRPSERKQILADLLKLNQYDALAEQAKERSRQHKAELSLLERTLETAATQLQQEAGIAAEQATLEALIAQMQQQQQADAETLRQLQGVQQQRQTWQQQLTLQQQQQRHLTQDCHRLQQELTAAQQQQQVLDTILNDGDAIAAGYAQFRSLQAEEEALTSRFQAHQAAQAQRQALQQQQLEATNLLKDQLRQAQAQLEALQQQEQEIQHTLSKAADIEAAVEQLRQARLRLSQLDQLQAQVSPMLQHRQKLQTQLDRSHAKLSARLEELQSAAQQLHIQRSRQPQLQQAALDVAAQIKHLEERRTYQQKVREKGLERRSFLERLQERQRDYERQLAELDHKIQMLKRGVEGHNWGTPPGNGQPNGRSVPQPIQAIEQGNLLSQSLASTVDLHPPSSTLAYPPCPLCDRSLDEHHWNLVLERHQTKQKEIQNQIWVIREQLSVSDREIQILRQEYRDVEQELAQYNLVLERRGQLQQQLHYAGSVQTALEQIEIEHAEIERSLQAGTVDADLQEELYWLDQRLKELNYDDKNHALARGEADRWRWADIKQAEVRQAQRRQAQIAERQPALASKIAALEQQLGGVDQSPLQQQIHQIDRHIAEIGYDVERHTAVRRAARQAQSWQLRYQEWGQAQQHYPQTQQRVLELQDILANRKQALAAIEQHIVNLTTQLQHAPDHRHDIQQLEGRMQQQRASLDEQLAHLGRLQQQQQQIEALKQQYEQQQQQVQTLRRQCRVYQELAQAFGKNGIQALMIENVLPQLEAEANQILGRLSANQLHVQFVTQRSGRRKGTARNPAKLIDTLDILIADVQGTRPYETYSGGEAFRVNFAIRLALARLLAQRSGAALQMLIVDEGFGTQDEAGCDRLIAAINAIANDFACILTVTHMPNFKSAFQTRIEVSKTSNGSHLTLCV